MGDDGDHGCSGVGERAEQQGQCVVTMTLGMSLKCHLFNTQNIGSEHTGEIWSHTQYSGMDKLNQVVNSPRETRKIILELASG